MKVYSSFLGDIYSGPVAGLSRIVEDVHPSAIFIIADQNTSGFCVPRLGDMLNNVEQIVIPAGEVHKNLVSCQTIWSHLVSKGADRDSLILNIGGGMVCDLGGFAASCYQRGIRFAHVPTTVMAMADAAYGGKTGIDFQGLKNYIGFIRVPLFIWIDDSFLETLPLTEKISGLAEIIKHAVIGSEHLWELLTGLNAVTDIRWNMVFEKNLPVKLKIIEADPTEKGIRKTLNFGHTVGHAVESYCLSKKLSVPHGNCIATGMVVESRISNAMGILNDEDFNAIVKLVNRLLEPVRISLPTFEDLNMWMMMDKKRSKEKLGFSLPDRIGSCGWDIPVDESIISESYNWWTQANN